MPTYDYRCPQCGKEVERITSSFAPEAPACPTCGGDMDKFLPKAPGAVMNGRGFYGSTYGKGGGRVK